MDSFLPSEWGVFRTDPGAPLSHCGHFITSLRRTCPCNSQHPHHVCRFFCRVFLTSPSNKFGLLLDLPFWARWAIYLPNREESDGSSPISESQVVFEVNTLRGEQDLGTLKIAYRTVRNGRIPGSVTLGKDGILDEGATGFP